MSTPTLAAINNMLKGKYLILLLWLFCHNSMAKHPVGCAQLEDMDWLLGNWQSEDKQTIEIWRKASQSTYEGDTFAIEHGESSHQESLLLSRMGTHIYFIAKPEQNPTPVVFALTSCSEDQILFQNLNHDFPNNIAYKKITKKHILVEVSDNRGKGFALDYHRTTLQPPFNNEEKP